jgi:hypothetical protein
MEGRPVLEHGRELGAHDGARVGFLLPRRDRLRIDLVHRGEVVIRAVAEVHAAGDPHLVETLERLFVAVPDRVDVGRDADVELLLGDPEDRGVELVLPVGVQGARLVGELAGAEHDPGGGAGLDHRKLEPGIVLRHRVFSFIRLLYRGRNGVSLNRYAGLRGSRPSEESRRNPRKRTCRPGFRELPLMRRTRSGADDGLFDDVRHEPAHLVVETERADRHLLAVGGDGEMVLASHLVAAAHGFRELLHLDRRDAPQLLPPYLLAGLREVAALLEMPCRLKEQLLHFSVLLWIFVFSRGGTTIPPVPALSRRTPPPRRRGTWSLPIRRRLSCRTVCPPASRPSGNRYGNRSSSRSRTSERMWIRHSFR